jgi:spore maturation protein CgeB
LFDNETFSIYYGLGDMKRKILYFLDHEEERLRIAHAGRNVALRRHREWHRWEDLLLGNWTDERDAYGVSQLNPGRVFT